MITHILAGSGGGRASGFQSPGGLKHGPFRVACYVAKLRSSSGIVGVSGRVGSISPCCP